MHCLGLCEVNFSVFFFSFNTVTYILYSVVLLEIAACTVFILQI